MLLNRWTSGNVNPELRTWKIVIALNQNPIFGFGREPIVIAQMSAQSTLQILSGPNVVLSQLSRMQYVYECFQMDEIKKPHISVRLCGPYWIRTSDPLLVRQVLWTSWAKSPFANTVALFKRGCKSRCIFDNSKWKIEKIRKNFLRQHIALIINNL